MYLFQSWNITLCSAFTNGNTWNVFFFAATVPFQFQSTTTFLKVIYDKFSGRGLLLGECQLHKTVSLPIIQVQFDGDSSVLLGKFDLPILELTYVYAELKHPLSAVKLNFHIFAILEDFIPSQINQKKLEPS